MANKGLELRPAWRNQWLLIAVIPLLFLMALAVSVAEPTSASAGAGERAEPPPVGMMWAIALAAIGVVFYRKYSWKFTIDDVRVSNHRGLVARNQKAVRISDMRSVELRQGVVQRLLNIGDLAFYSAGSASAEVLFKGIKNPAIVRDDIQRLLDEKSGDR